METGREAPSHKYWGSDASYGLVLSAVEAVGRVLGEEGTWFMHESPCPWLLYRIGRSKPARRPGGCHSGPVGDAGGLGWGGDGAAEWDALCI